MSDGRRVWHFMEQGRRPRKRSDPKGRRFWDFTVITHRPFHRGVSSDVTDNVRNKFVHVAPGGAENTRWDTHQKRTVSQGKLSPIFGWWFSEVYSSEGSECLCVEASKKCPYPAACVSLWRLPSLATMTHMR